MKIGHLQKRQAYWWWSWNRVPVVTIMFGKMLGALFGITVNSHLDN